MTGQPWCTASWAASTAPMPANVAWQSQIIPPSPVTRVIDRKMIAKQTPCPIRPTQNPLRTSGRMHRIAKANKGSCQPKVDA